MSRNPAKGIGRVAASAAARRETDWRPINPYREVWQTTIRTAGAVVIVRADSSHEGLCMRQQIVAALEENGRVVLDEEQRTPDDWNPTEIL